MPYICEERCAPPALCHTSLVVLLTKKNLNVEISFESFFSKHLLFFKQALKCLSDKRLRMILENNRTFYGCIKAKERGEIHFSPLISMENACEHQERENEQLCFAGETFKVWSLQYRAYEL